MHETRQFDSDWDYRELRRMLLEAISRGYVEQIPVMTPIPSRRTESGSVIGDRGNLFLRCAGGKIRGRWERVDPQDLVQQGKLCSDGNGEIADNNSFSPWRFYSPVRDGAVPKRLLRGAIKVLAPIAAVVFVVTARPRIPD